MQKIILSSFLPSSRSARLSSTKMLWWQQAKTKCKTKSRQARVSLPGGGGCRSHTTTESLSSKAEGDFLAIIQKNYILSRDLITSLNITGTSFTLHISHKCRNSSGILTDKGFEEQAAGGRQAESQP